MHGGYFWEESDCVAAHFEQITSSVNDFYGKFEMQNNRVTLEKGYAER